MRPRQVANDWSRRRLSFSIDTGSALWAFDQVIATAGVTKTTFYKHFESKDELMVAAVQRRDEWESQAWDRAVRKLAGDDPARQLLAMLDVMDLWFNDPDFHGCMFVNAAAEFPNPHDPVHQAAAANKRRTRDQLRVRGKPAERRVQPHGVPPAPRFVEADLCLPQVRSAICHPQRTGDPKVVTPRMQARLRSKSAMQC